MKVRLFKFLAVFGVAILLLILIGFARNYYLHSRLVENWKEFNQRESPPFGYRWVNDSMGVNHVGYYNYFLGPYIYK